MTATGLKPCNKCGLPVRWAKEQGRSQCFNANGTVHWDACSQERTRLANAEGVPFSDKGPNADEKHATGVRWCGKKHYRHRQGHVVAGKEFKHSCGECSVPPWEVCACSFAGATA